MAEDSLFHEHQMTVGQLADKLATLPRDLYVILSGDEEGNRFSPLALEGLSLGTYVPESTYHGYLHVDDDDIDGDIAEGDEIPEPKNPNCVVFWPIN